MKKIRGSVLLCVMLAMLSFTLHSTAYANPPKDKGFVPVPPPGDSGPNLLGKAIDRPNPLDHQQMSERQKLFELRSLQLATGLSSDAIEPEFDLLAKAAADRVLVILVEFGGPDSFTWTRGTSTWDPLGKSDTDENCGNLGTPAACYNIADKLGLTTIGSQKVFTYSGPLHNQIPQPVSETDASGDMIWTADFNPSFYKNLIAGKGVRLLYQRQDGSKVNQNFKGYSVKRYYEDMSNKAYTFNADVIGWVQVPHSAFWYGADSCPGSQSGADVAHNGGIPDAGNAMSLVRDALNAVKAARPTFNWSLYDQNGDGVIDRLWIIHAGLGEEDDTVVLNRTDYGEGGLWSHSGGVIPYYEVAPGLKVGPYVMMPENCGIGVLAHEFGHNLGADDLYAYNGGETSAGFWTIMADDWTGYPIGFLPAAFDPWHLDNWGWLKPKLIADPTQVYTVTLGQTSATLKSAGIYRGIKIPLPERYQTLSVHPTGTYQWWGGKENLKNSMMTTKNPITLPGGETTLSFSTAYDLEQDYDFLWVQVSVDGGKQWTTLANAHTSCNHATDWIGGLYGFPADLCGAGAGGFTGRSGAFPAYGTESFDLSAYAGRSILLRFWYMTDWGSALEGPFIDDVRIVNGTSTLFQDGAESGNSAWAFAGAWESNNGARAVTHNFYFQWRNVSATGGYDKALSDTRWRFGPANTGLLTWYNDNAFTDNEISWNRLLDSPGFGPKGRMLVADAHPEPYRDPYYAEGWPNEASNVWHRSQVRDAPFSLHKAVDFTMHPPFVHSETAFTGPPAVSRFSDARGYYPGFEYANLSPYYNFPHWMTKQWDASVVMPSNVFYGINAPGYLANDEFYFGCSRYGSDGIWVHWFDPKYLGYNGGTGNPGDVGGEYGWNVKILSQTASKATVRVWNSQYSNPYDCTCTFRPSNRTFRYTGGRITLKVAMSGENCILDDPVSSQDWITATSAYTKGRNWKVTISVAANPDQAPRTGTVQIAGSVFNVSQSGKP